MEAYAINDWDELEALYFGNVAVPQQRAGQGTERLQPAPATKEVKRVRKEKIIKQKERKAAILRQYKEHEQYISRKRFREAVFAVIGIAMIAMMFSFILYRQSRITTTNYENNAAVSRINKLREETSQIKENLTVSLNLDDIRWQAMERLGMQEPAITQKVTVEIPGSDILVMNDFESVAINSKISLAAAKENLAQYYSAMD